MTVTVEYANALTVTRDFTFDITINCNTTPIVSQLNTVYSYIRGNPIITITRPSVVLIDCTVCAVTDNTPSHAWWTSATDFEISTNDPTLIGTQAKVTFTDVDILTSGPGACSETVTPTIELINPCEDTPTVIEAHIIAD